MGVTVLDDSNFEQELEGAEHAIVDFFASWCGPCIMFKPKFKRISNDYPHVRFFMLDGQKAPNARKSVTIDNLPFFGVYREGEFVTGSSMSDEAAFRSFLDTHFGAPK
jgi:thiol-disulfide isomerase/thioredoxin